MRFPKWLMLCGLLAMFCGAVQAKEVLKMDGGKLQIAKETKRSLAASDLSGTTLNGHKEAIAVSRDAWIDGQFDAPTKLDNGTISFWIYPLDWNAGEGWRVVLNWRNLLGGATDPSNSMWVRGDPQGNIVFMMGDFETKKYDLLLFALPGKTAPQWTHIAITWNSETMQVFANGQSIIQKPRVLKTPVTLGQNFKIGGPHGSGVEQGSAALAFLEVDDEALSAEQIQARMKSQNTAVTTAPKPSPEDAAAASDLMSARFGATAYASSFTLELDPRKVIQRQENALWTPDASDKKPRFYVAWPGAVVFDQITLQGNMTPNAVRVFAGADRLELKEFAAKTERAANGDTVLNFETPINARVLELHFAPNTPTSLRQISASIAAPEKLTTQKTIFLQKDKTQNIELGAGQRVRFELDASVFPSVSQLKPWMLEIDQPASDSFRAWQDFRAARTMVSQSGKQASAIADISPHATSGEYGIYLSRLGEAAREQIGTVKIQGRALPQWTANQQPGFPQVKLDLESRLLPHITTEAGSTPVLIMVLGATSFEKIAAYQKTGSRLWRFNASAAALLDTPDIAKNVQVTLAEVEQNVKNILALAPDTNLIIGLDTRPRAGWIAKYKEDTLQRTTSGKMGFGINFGSQQLREDSKEAARLFTEELAKKPYANRIVGLLPYFGRGGDGWGYGIDQAGWVTRDKIELADRAPAEAAGFEKWLEQKYGAPLNETLKPHWPAVALTQPTRVPTDLRLASMDNGLFIDPTTKQDVVDYWEYRGVSVMDAILDFGEAVQKASGNRLLYGAHYGYTLSSLRNQAPGVSQLGGHFKLHEMLSSDAVTMVNGGSSGDKRGPTSNYEVITPLGSASLHKKLVVLELDNRTPLTRGVPPFEYYQLFSFDDFVNGARKDIGFALTHGAGLHWYDMSSPQDRNEYFREPWYIEDDFFALTQQAMKLGAQPATSSAMAAPVAVFMDENVIAYQDVYNSFVYENLLRYLREGLAQSGVDVRFYLLQDYEAWSKTPAAADTKMEVFLNGWLEPKAGWKTIAASPRAQLWFYGADLLSSQKLNTMPATRAILGFDLAQRGELKIENSKLTLDAAFQKSASALPAFYGNHPYSELHASQRNLFGESLAAHYVPEAQNGFTTLARFADGTPGLTQSKVDGHTRFFSSLPYMPAKVLRALYERVGITSKVPFGDWWVAEGRGMISINTQEKVSDPQLLQNWLQKQKLVLGDISEPVTPGQSYIVQSATP